MYDRKKLKRDIAENVFIIKALKRDRRESGQPNWFWPKMRELAKAKKRATLLCSIAAHLRGKIHLPGLNRDAQEELIREELRRYAVDLLAVG